VGKISLIFPYEKSPFHQSHEKLVNQLVAKAEAMIRSGHFAAEDIQDTVRHLKEGYGQLKDLAAIRKLRLSDAVESQQFFFKLNDTLDWIKVFSHQVNDKMDKKGRFSQSPPAEMIVLN
jgi:hypothetical protein